MTHVRTSPYYPQSNGKLERWHKSLKAECIRPGTPLTPEDARRLIQQYVDHYNTVRLHSAIGFITPAGHAGGTASRDPCGARSQVRRSAPATTKAPAAGGVSRRATMTLPGETEAGSAGMQPCRGIAWWAHRDDVERGSFAFRALPKQNIGSVDPYALKIPAPKGRNLTNGERSSSISR